MNRPLLVTGGAGFIGSNFVRRWLRQEDSRIINLDHLTYAGNLHNLAGIDRDRHIFVHGSICDTALLDSIFSQHQPSAVIHFAAESHVDRSIKSPELFLNTNVLGTLRLLDAARHYLVSATESLRQDFKFLHVSTDEVYGSLTAEEAAFTESSPYRPNSPYAASKAASDHLVRSYFHTYGFPAIVTNCSNNFGPYQFPEKLIPLMIVNGLEQRQLPVYGDGLNVRDWLYVTDHCEALCAVLAGGVAGETYNIGGNSERTNLQVVKAVCEIIDDLVPCQYSRFQKLVKYVTDRPGHDRRYAINGSKIKRDLQWSPKVSFEQGIRETVQWYFTNSPWISDVISGSYRDWIVDNYEKREFA